MTNQLKSLLYIHLLCRRQLPTVTTCNTVMTLQHSLILYEHVHMCLLPCNYACMADSVPH